MGATLNLEKTPEFGLTPRERADYGVTVTVREKTSGELLTLAAQGAVTEAIGNACDRVDWLKGNWEVVTVSTPSTIFRDLQGMRDVTSGSPEKTILAKVKRLDLHETRGEL